MLDFIKNKASAAASYVADKAKDTMEWYADMEVTPREKIIATVAGIGAFGAAWAAFSLGFGSAPLTLATAAATPAVTTALTGLAAGTFMLGKKAIAGGLNLAIDGIQALAATHPDRNEGTTFGAKVYRGVARNFGQGTRFDRWFAGEYQPQVDTDEYADYHNYAIRKAEPLTEKEKKGLITDLSKDVFGYIKPASLFSKAEEMDARPTAYDKKTLAQIAKLPFHTTRSGTRFMCQEVKDAVQAEEAANKKPNTRSRAGKK